MIKEIRTNTNTNFLKLIGMITMFCDHAGVMLFPDIILLRAVGRTAFPLFAYCVAVGSVYTRNTKRYLLRLVLFAVLLQAGYMIYCLPTWEAALLDFNIFFTLSIGLACIMGIRQGRWLLVELCILASFFLNIDYGVGGVLLIITFYIFIDNPLLSAIFIIPQTLFTQTGHSFINTLTLQSFSVLSLPFIYLKTAGNINPKINKYVFYAFYPLHFAVLYLIKLICYRY